jgi:hypothetical protein
VGKRIDQLALNDTPIESADERETSWGRFVDEIETLLATGRFTFALETLEGIAETVRLTERVTPAQRRAVENIEAGQNLQRRINRRWRR